MNLKDRILQNIKINEITGCLIWQKSCNGDGYGQIWVDGKKKSAHRVAYELFKGPIPKGLCVCHSCDNPRCCNPKHLWLGTHQENQEDMYKKGRQGNLHVPHPNADFKGSKNSNAKLTDEKVIEIRILLTKGELQRIIAERFGVSQVTISEINLNKTWKHLDEKDPIY